MTQTSFKLSSFIVLISISLYSCFESKESTLNQVQESIDYSFIATNVNNRDNDSNDKKAEQFYELGKSFFETKEYEKAKPIFLSILENDTTQLFNEDHYYTSDVEEFITEELQGYGSFSLNYKSKAAIYLAKIAIEAGNFENALDYIFMADKEYPVAYNCGTGNLSYTNQLKYLYVLSYEGLEEYDKAIESILPNFHHWQLSPIFIRILKKKYSTEELLQEMENAIEHFEFTQDLAYTEVTQTSGSHNETTTNIKYLSGKGTMMFFDYHLELPKLSLDNGEIATKEMYIDHLKASNFYQELSGKKTTGEQTLNEGTITLQSW